MKLLLSGICFLVSVYLTGYVCDRHILKIQSKKSYLAIGLVGQLAFLELFGWFMVAFRLPSVLFLLLFVAMNLAVFGLALKDVRKLTFKFTRENWNVYRLAFYLLLLFTVIMLILFYVPDADDSFYVSNVELFANSSQLNPYDSSFGDKASGTVPMYDFQIWESYLAMYCKIFKVSAAAFCHAVLPIALLLISMSAYYMVGKALFNDLIDNSKIKKAVSLFLFILLLIFIFEGQPNGYSKGTFLLTKLWQGKSVYVNVCMPILLAMFADMKVRSGRKSAIYLTVIILAGVALNPTSMYVLGFTALFVVVSWAILDKNAKQLLSLIPSLLVIAGVTLMIYLRTKGFEEQLEAAAKLEKNFVLNQGKLVFAGEG